MNHQARSATSPGSAVASNRSRTLCREGCEGRQSRHQKAGKVRMTPPGQISRAETPLLAHSWPCRRFLGCRTKPVKAHPGLYGQSGTWACDHHLPETRILSLSPKGVPHQWSGYRHSVAGSAAAAGAALASMTLHPARQRDTSTGFHVHSSLAVVAVPMAVAAVAVVAIVTNSPTQSLGHDAAGG